MKYELYVHRQIQIRYLRAAVNRITSPPFRPDAKTPANMATIVADYSLALAGLIGKNQAASAARGHLASATATGHEAATAVYACMKSCYRKAPECLAVIVRLPKQDRSPTATLMRMQSTAQCWAGLPNVPGTSGPLVVGETTLAVFNGLITTLDTAITAATDADGAETAEAATMRLLDADTENLVVAALAQGRSHYKEGTPNRAYIDAIPTEPSTQKPEQAVVSLAESPAAGAARLVFVAGHATSFQVWHKGPGEPKFAQVADVLKPGEYEAAGLAAGRHEYQIVGENSRGEGPASAVAPVDVAAANVA